MYTTRVDAYGRILVTPYSGLGFVPGATVEVIKTIAGSLIVVVSDPVAIDGRALDAAATDEQNTQRLALDSRGARLAPTELPSDERILSTDDQRRTV